MLNDQLTPFLDLSAYIRQSPELRPALATDLKVDVAIVGGGFTGLSTALELTKRGISVAVLERHFCGYGASGRNAGHLTPTICKDLPTAKMLFGEEKAGRLASFADHCVERTEHLMREYAIDCDYNQSGNIMAVVHPSQEKKMREAAAAARRLGAKIHFAEAGEMRERGLPAAFLCGAMEEMGGTLDPGKLIMGLRKAALERGVPIYENTHVTQIEKGKPFRIVTPGGTVRAEKIFIATNAFTPEVGYPGNRMYPLYCTQFETIPLSDAQIEAIGGWRNREGFYTAHESMESYRLTSKRTLIGGAKVSYFRDCLPHNHGGDADSVKPLVLQCFRERFPELQDLPIAHAWAGWIGMTMNFLPIVGQAKSIPNYFYSVGYNGHGVAQSIAMGELNADLITGRPNNWSAVICRSPVYVPPRSILWFIFVAIMGLLNYLDRRTNRKIIEEANQRRLS